MNVERNVEKGLRVQQDLVSTLVDLTKEASLQCLGLTQAPLATVEVLPSQKLLSLKHGGGKLETRYWKSLLGLDLFRIQIIFVGGDWQLFLTVLCKCSAKDGPFQIEVDRFLALLSHWLR